MSFIRTGLRELRLKVRRQRTRMSLRRERRHLQRAEIYLGREGVEQAGNFPELRNEIVALKKLEQEQREVAVRITHLEEGLKQIERERADNSRQQNENIAKLEEDKKPLLQQRASAKATADLCTRELSAVEKRIQENDAADRDLLQQISMLQAQAPPPADVDVKTDTLSGQRARLPDERAELVRARLGSADACRLANEKLAAADAELATADRNIARVREEFAARDAALNEKARALQDQLKEARLQHQTVEERKNPAYLNIGRHLASRGIPPPNAPHLLQDVQRRREIVDHHVAHTAELELLSGEIDKQDLRKFYFCVVSVVVLLAFILPLLFQSTGRHDWLPQESESILSVNVEQIGRDDLVKRWRAEQPDAWQRTWLSLLGAAVGVPHLNIERDVARVTRAMVTEANDQRDFVLVEARGDVARVVRGVAEDKAFERSTMSGLPVWRSSDTAIARVGLSTLAVGRSAEVNELVQVRLGAKRDLKITGQMFDRFDALDRDSSIRVISREPDDLVHVFHPIFPKELFADANLVGLALSLQNPVRCRLVIRTATPDRASELAQNIKADPARLLHLENSVAPLFAQPPSVDRNGNNVELRWPVPEPAARILLQRLAKTDAPDTVAQQ